MLGQQGYEVRPIPNGKMALTAIEAAPPDLILLDIKMPELDGYELCKQLKAAEATRDIPIIFISALDEVLDKVKAFGAGGLDYITKPFQFEEVLARVETHLTLHHLQQQLQAANAELLSANTALKAANAELDTFAHTVAHDLQNPLGLIIGYSDYLIENFSETEPDQLLKILQTIRKTGQKMSNITEELLLLASVRKGSLKLEPLNMAEIVEQVQQRLAFMIQEYQAEILLPESWPVAQGYAPWIEEVWANYLSNGLKYGGRPPHLELGASLQEERLIRFWIRDNGSGLTPEAQAQLFTQFTRLDATRATGHGLGLSIVKRIVEKLGGQVRVESTGVPGEGSVFSFTLPR
jgi:signal transduction histidine kinase